MNRAKGTTVAFIRTFMGTQPDSVRDAFLDSLTSEDQVVYATGLPIAWFDVEQVDRIYAAAAAAVFPDDPRGIEKLGEHNADHDLRTIYKLFLRVATVQFAIKQAARLWKTYHDSGVPLVEEKKGENALSFYIRNYPGFPEVYRRVISGYIVGLFGLAGAKDTVVDLDDSDPMAWKWNVTWT